MSPRIARHLGVSFVPGRDLVHVFVEGDPSAATLVERWNRRVAGLGLAPELTPGADAGHYYAPAYPFLGPSHVADAVSLPDDPESEQQAALLLAPLAMDRGNIERSYSLYREVAHARGWVAMPALLGRFASCLVGVGRHARWLSLNVGEHTATPITFAGTNKGYGREFLKAHGLPVAPGGHASTPEAAVRRAGTVGFPVVLKGLQSGNSEAVILGIEDAETCAEAARILMGAENAPILVEKMVVGVEVRAHFAAGKLHSVYRAVARHVEGDGKQSLLKLLHHTMPDFLRMALSHPLMARRLVFQLFRFGVRKVEDLARLVVAEGESIRVSAATFAGMEQLPLDTVHAEDRRRLEALFERYGSPSAGVDLMLPALGRPLSEGGIVIELNCPCGFGYVSDPLAVATLELDALVARAPGFVEADGRVPVWVVTEEDFASPERRRAILEATECPEHAIGVHRADPELGWLPILGDGKDHLLVVMNEDTVTSMGMPDHLRPVLVAADSDSLLRSHPRLIRTGANAGGTVTAIPTPS